MSYTLPQVIVHQEFEAAPAGVSEPLRACIIGPNYDLHRYSDADEKPAIKVSDSYDPDTETCFSWPGRKPGGVVDETYTKVFIDEALLRYFHDAIAAGDVILPTGRNKIRADATVWKTANGYSRNALLNSRDVQVGDVVKLISTACGTPVEFTSSVLGFEADVVPAVIHPATSDSGNQAALTPSATGTQTGGPSNLVDMEVIDGAAYNGVADGNPSEVYTIEVIGGSVGGSAVSAILKITSASGNDDVATMSPAAFGSPTAIGTRGLLVTFNNNGISSSSGVSSSSSSVSPGTDKDDFVVGQKWRVAVAQAWTPPGSTAGGSYAGTSNTTYVVEVTRGGLYADSVKPQISVSTTTGVDISGPTTVTAAATAVAIGTKGLTLQFSGTGLNKGDRYYVVVVAASAGPIKTLLLANNLPDGFLGTCLSSSGTSSWSSSHGGTDLDLDVQLFIKDDIQVPANRTGFAPLTNWTQSATELCLQAGIITYDASWTDVGTGAQLPLEVLDGKVYVEHRDLLTTRCNIVGTVEDVSAVQTALGVVHPDNPLAFGVYKALTNSAGVSVKYVALCGTDLEDWLDALDKLVGYQGSYGLVPLSQDKAVLDAVTAHCLAESAPEKGRWRVSWINMTAIEIKPIYAQYPNGTPLLATITDDPETSGVQNTLVTVVNGKLIANGVRAGDTLRGNYVGDGFGNFTYSEYVIDAVLSEESCRLVSGPSAPVSVAAKVEVHRTLTVEELADDLALNPGLFSTRRAYLTWPDRVGNAGTEFAGYFLSAGLAGLRSGVLPHQGLTNVELLGFDDVTRTTELFSASQLDKMAEAGYWIVTQNEDDGSIISRHQLSTDNTDLNTKEQSITSNLDDISMAVLVTMKEFIGKGNVSPEMLTLIEAELRGLLSGYVNTVTVKRLGPQIQDYEIVELQQHPTLKDRVTCRVNLTLPYPLNVLEIHLVV